MFERMQNCFNYKYIIYNKWYISINVVIWTEFIYGLIIRVYYLRSLIPHNNNRRSVQWLTNTCQKVAVCLTVLNNYYFIKPSWKIVVQGS